MSDHIQKLHGRIAELRAIGELLNKDKLVAHGILHKAERCLDEMRSTLRDLERDVEKLKARAATQARRVAPPDPGEAAYVDQCRRLYRRVIDTAETPPPRAAKQRNGGTHAGAAR